MANTQYTSYSPGDPQFQAGFGYPSADANLNPVNNVGVPILAGPADPTTNTGWQAASAPLVQALQDAAKSSVFNPKDPPGLAPAQTREVAAGRPRQAASLDQLVQLLEKQRAQYGTLSGQPVQRAQVLGLLGF